MIFSEGCEVNKERACTYIDYTYIKCSVYSSNELPQREREERGGKEREKEGERDNRCLLKQVDFISVRVLLRCFQG